MSCIVKVILVSRNIRNTGKVGEVVSVKAGYASYLVREGLAIFATGYALSELEKQKEKYNKILADSMISAKETKEKLSAVEKITIKARTTSEGKLFGSISSRNIAAKISEDYAIVLNSENIIVKRGVIKSVGQYDIEIFLATEVSHFMQVVVVQEDLNIVN